MTKYSHLTVKRAALWGKFTDGSFMTRTRFKECHRLARLGSLGTLALSTPNEFFGWMLHEVYDVRFPHIGGDRHAARDRVATFGRFAGNLKASLVAWHNRRGWYHCGGKSLLRLWTEFKYKGGNLLGN